MNGKYFAYAVALTIVVTIVNWYNLVDSSGSSRSGRGSSWSSHGSSYGGGGGGHK
jgi:uncharacterized membrane protein YgcG